MGIIIETFKIKFSISFVKRLNLESVIRSILSSAKLQSFLHSYGCLKSQNMICNFQWLQQSYKVFIQPLLWLHENFVILLPENDYRRAVGPIACHILMSSFSYTSYSFVVIKIISGQSTILLNMMLLISQPHFTQLLLY